MNFYTLTYDANLPTKQQLNIPTNTDYKVGIKVTANGVELPLDPATTTLNGLSADSEKVNGYLMFSKSAGDDASMVQEKLSIDFTPPKQILTGSAGRSRVVTVTPIVSLSSYASRTLKLDEFYVAMLTRDYSSDPYTEEEVESGMTPTLFWPMTSSGSPAIRVQTGTGATNNFPAYFQSTSQWDQTIRALPLEEQLTHITKPLPPEGTPYALFGDTRGGDTRYTPVTEIEIGEDMYAKRTYSGKNMQYGIGVKVQIAPAIKTSFNMIENIYKSQLGDTADIDFSNTVNIAGTMSDETEFNFDAVVK